MATAIEQLDDLMECPICTDVYKDPRTLPCQHSFCLVCCEGFSRDKLPRDNVECPLCREKFTIPPIGVRGLRKNFVLEKLKQINQQLPGPQADTRLKEIETSLPSYCDKHSNKALDVYCLGCKEAICTSCLKNHKSHQVLAVEEVVDELRVTLKSGITDLETIYKKYKLTLNEIETEEVEFMKHIQTIENEICEDAKRLRKIIEKSKSELLAEVETKKSERLKEVENTKQEVRQQIAFINSLMSYTTELLKRGGAGDVAREADSLGKRTSKLLEGDESKTASNQLGVFTLAYTSREAQLTEIGYLVGSISPMRVNALTSLPQEYAIHGITTLHQQLFVIQYSQGIALYDTETYNMQRRLQFPPGLGSFNDLVACQQYQCIYISDFIKKLVHKVEVKTNQSDVEYTKWSVEDEPHSLSVNSDYNVIVTCPKANKIEVFTTHGNLLQVIQLQPSSHILHPKHTIQLTADKYLLCRSGGARVCVIDGTGQLHQSFEGRAGSGDNLLNAPVRLAVINGFIFVVDEINRRVVMLSPTLRYIRTLLSFSSDLLPTRICFDHHTSRLYVTENKVESGKWTTAHVNVYNIN